MSDKFNIDNFFKSEDDFAAIREPKDYAGNGWSKYQIFVLHQLADHNKLLRELSASLTALSTEVRLLNQRIQDQEEAMGEQQTDQDSIGTRVASLEQEKRIQSAIDLKTKAIWTGIGGASAVVIGFIFQAIPFVFNFLKHIIVNLPQ